MWVCICTVVCMHEYMWAHERECATSCICVRMCMLVWVSVSVTAYAYESTLCVPSYVLQLNKLKFQILKFTYNASEELSEFILINVLFHICHESALFNFPLKLRGSVQICLNFKIQNLLWKPENSKVSSYRHAEIVCYHSCRCTIFQLWVIYFM